MVDTSLIKVPSTITSEQYTYDPISDIPGVTTQGEGGLENYLQNIFNLGVGVAGLLAVLMLIFCGLQYVTANTFTSKEDAKKCIWLTLGGLFVVLAAVAILTEINPRILSFGVFGTSGEGGKQIGGDLVIGDAPSGAPTFGQPAVSLSADKSFVTFGKSEPVTLKWVSNTQVRSCTGSGFETGGKANGDTTITLNVVGDVTFSVSCIGASGEASDSVTVTALAPTTATAVSAYCYDAVVSNTPYTCCYPDPGSCPASQKCNEVSVPVEAGTNDIASVYEGLPDYYTKSPACAPPSGGGTAGEECPLEGRPNCAIETADCQNFIDMGDDRCDGYWYCNGTGQVNAVGPFPDAAQCNAALGTGTTNGTGTGTDFPVGGTGTETGGGEPTEGLPLQDSSDDVTTAAETLVAWLEASPATVFIPSAPQSKLTWCVDQAYPTCTASGGARCQLSPKGFDGSVPRCNKDTGITVCPTVNTKFTITCASEFNEKVSSSALVTVEKEPLAITSFLASETELIAGELTTIEWDSTGATVCKGNPSSFNTGLRTTGSASLDTASLDTASLLLGQTTIGLQCTNAYITDNIKSVSTGEPAQPPNIELTIYPKITVAENDTTYVLNRDYQGCGAFENFTLTNSDVDLSKCGAGGASSSRFICCEYKPPPDEEWCFKKKLSFTEQLLYSTGLSTYNGTECKISYKAEQDCKAEQAKVPEGELKESCCERGTSGCFIQY